MTDTCDPACKFCRLFVQHIEAVILEHGVPRAKIHSYKANYWQHLWNIWVG
jgi:hypothetical protein